MRIFGRILTFPPGRGRVQSDRRGNRRVAVSMTGLLSGGGWKEEVSVVNLSGGGAMVETRLPLRLGERFDLTINGWGTVPVVVRWVSNDHAGLEFER